MHELLVIVLLTVAALVLSGNMVESPAQEAPGAKSVRRLGADWYIVPADENYKLIPEKNVLKLAPEDDEFGSKVDEQYWEELDGSSVISTWEGKAKAKLMEDGKALTCNDGGASAWALAARRKVAYASADLVFEWSDTGAADRHYGAGVAAFLWRDAKNFVRISYVSRSIAANHRITVAAMVNNTWKTLLDSRSIGLHKKLRLRIKRDARSNTFTCYYAVWNSEKSGWKDWEHAWSGKVEDKEHFSTSHSLYPVVAWRKEGANAEAFTPKLNRYYQYELEMPAQRFWSDMPQCDIVDSGAGGAEFCLDAGMGKMLKLEGFTAQVSEPGNSSVAFRAAFGDSPKRASAIWIGDGKWLTAQQLNEKVASGVLDGHRYAFLRVGMKSDGTVQPTLTSVTFTGTPADTYGACMFDTYFATVDRNEKVFVEKGIAKLAPEGDVFGDLLDNTHWTKTEKGVNVSEAGGIAFFDKTGTTRTHGALERSFTYSSCDIAVDWTKNHPINGAGYQGRVSLALRRDARNLAIMMYSARSTDPGWQVIDYGYYINGAFTWLGWKIMGSCDTMKLRIKRDSATNTFAFYYDIGAGWVKIWSGVILDVTHFNTRHLLYPQLLTTCVSTPNTAFDPEADRYYQVTDDGIPAQRFWDDSPVALVVRDSSVNWALDAGEGKRWKLRDAECEKTEPGDSSVKFKVGVSDTGVHYDATWKDEKWLTIEQVNANAASGRYDGHRYIHVKAQFNSDGTQQPTLRSFRIHGSKEDKNDQ